MHSILLAVAATGMASLATAFTKPGEATWGPLLTPDLTHPVTQGQTAEITWDPEDHPTDGVTVSIVLCHGPSTNCVTADTAIVEGVPASQKSYEWSVPSDLAPGKQSTETGYGLLIIVDGTGEFQYSTQFSVLEGKGGSSGSSSSSSPSKPTVTSTDSAGSIILGPPAQQTGSYTWASTLSGNFTGTGSWDSTATSYPIGGTTISISTTATGFTATASLLTSVTGVASTTPLGATGSSTATGSAVGASDFPGAADRLNLNVAGLAIAGAIAVFAL